MLLETVERGVHPIVGLRCSRTSSDSTLRSLALGAPRSAGK